MDRLLIATTNAGKVREIREMLSFLPISVLTPDDLSCRLDVAEDGETLQENALKKAKAYFEVTGVTAVADDTGLEVDALGGAPGVRSARFAGEGATDRDNRAKMLAMLAGAPTRTARFRTVVALADDQRTQVFSGVCEGEITQNEVGSRGFGYDSIFIPNGERRTFGQMSSAGKNAISHRAIAMKKLAEYLADVLGAVPGSRL